MGRGQRAGLRTREIDDDAFLKLALSVLAVAAFVGDAQPAVADQPANAFAGHWFGSFTSSTGAAGLVDWEISSVGRLSGTVYSTTFELVGTMVGHVSDDGDCRIVGWPVPTQTGAEPHSGFACIDEDGRLVASTENHATHQEALAVLERVE